MKRTVVVAGAALALMLGAGGVATAVPTSPFADCAAAAAAGLVNIPAGSQFYREELDRDGDGIACESGAPDGTAPVGDPSAGTDEASDGASDGASDDVAADQVSVVPEGGAATGDASSGSGTAWWVGGGVVGGLLAALAAAGPASRERRRAGFLGR